MSRAGALLIAALTLAAVAAPVRADAPTDSTRATSARLRQLSPKEMDEVLWLARCLISEADRANEQRLVAWVVRNRVETGYRGSDYRDVILERLQFSAFNEPSARRDQILAYNQNTAYGPWQSALRIALDVYQAPAEERPFSATTRHFYSPISMPNHAAPAWAQGAQPVDVSSHGIDPFRFQFFDSVDENGGYAASAAPLVRDASERIARQKERVEAAQPQARKRGLSGRTKRPTRPSLTRPTRRS